MLAHPALSKKLDAPRGPIDAQAHRRRCAILGRVPIMSPRLPTSREIEVKLRVTDLRALVRSLKRLGAKLHGRVLEQNTLYDTPSADFRSRGRLLRLRIETPASSKLLPGGTRCAILTSKAPVPESVSRSRYKERLEREVAVEGSARWPPALRAIGLHPTFRYEKYRTTFRLPDLHLDLDETPVGTFLELEGPPHAIDRVARALGYAPGEYIKGTYWDLYAADCRRRGRRPTNMLLSA